MSAKVEKSLKELNFRELIKSHGEYYSSPDNWEDEVLYFLMLDRFSNGKEFAAFGDILGDEVKKDKNRTTPLFNINKDCDTVDEQEWFKAGKKWCGGTLNGLKDKIGYLKRMGVSAIWVSPVFKQVSGNDDYHGYGIQNFLDVDKHFGTREDLVDLVKEAHKSGIRIILDIILNHAGDVFAYKGNDGWHNYDNGKMFEIEGLRKNSTDSGSIKLPLSCDISDDEGVWPKEFQKEGAWTRKGQICNWDRYPEYLDGDFYSLKDIDHGIASKDPSISWDLKRRIAEFRPGVTLYHLIDVYKFWIAYADIDGFRIDTVKHMEPGATRIFVNSIHEFAQFIGKENFYLIGEVTGGRANAVSTVCATGLDAALGIDDIQDKLEFLAKGYRSPGDPSNHIQLGYFDYFRNSILDDKHTHQWYSKHIVVMFDDHDQVGVKHKFRFCGDNGYNYRFLMSAIGLNLTTLGIPCIYYGTEQAFNGSDFRTDRDDYSDVFLRECMFGGDFGSFRSSGRHFFNEKHPVYEFMADICKLRNENITLRRGRQYLREVSATGNESDFYYPAPVGHELRWVIAWSRMFSDDEIVCAINTDGENEIGVWVTIDSGVNNDIEYFECIYSINKNEVGNIVKVDSKNGKSIFIKVQAAGFVIYKQKDC